MTSLKQIKIPAFAPMLLFLAVTGLFMVGAWNHPIHDFANYYFGARSIFEIGAFDLYDPVEFNAFIQGHTHLSIFANYSPHPPFTRWLFLPFIGFPVFAAKMIFNLFSLMVFAWSLQRLFHSQQWDLRLLLILPLLLWVPLKNNLLFGQTYLLLTALLIETFLSYRNRKVGRAAFFLALAVVLKLSPVLLLLFFLARKEVRLVLWSAIFIVGFICLDGLLGGWETWRIYLTEILPRASNGLINIPFAVNFQSLLALFKYLFAFDPNYNLHPPIKVSWLPGLLNKFAQVFLLTSAIYLSKKEDALFGFSFFVLALTIVAPIGSSYAPILSVLALACLYAHLHDWRKKIGLLALFALALNVPVQIFEGQMIWVYFTRLLLLCLLALMFMPLLTQKQRWMALGLALLLSLPFLALKQKQDLLGTAVLDPLDTRICKHFNLLETNVELNYLDRNGFGKSPLNDPSAPYAARRLRVEAPGIFDGSSRLFTFAGHVSEAILINEKTVFFLSDQNHGYHFYQLRRYDLE